MVGGRQGRDDFPGGSRRHGDSTPPTTIRSCKNCPAAIGSALSSPAYFNHRFIYQGDGDVMKAFAVTNAVIHHARVPISTSFGYHGSTPSFPPMAQATPSPGPSRLTPMPAADRPSCTPTMPQPRPGTLQQQPESFPGQPRRRRQVHRPHRRQWQGLCRRGIYALGFWQRHFPGDADHLTQWRHFHQFGDRDPVRCHPGRQPLLHSRWIHADHQFHLSTSPRLF